MELKKNEKNTNIKKEISDSNVISRKTVTIQLYSIIQLHPYNKEDA